MKALRILLAAACLGASVFPIWSQEGDISGWLLGSTSRTARIANYPIREKIAAPYGFVINLTDGNRTLRVILASPVALKDLETALQACREQILTNASIPAKQGELVLGDLEVLGANDGSFIVQLSVRRFILRLNDKTALDFGRALERPPEFTISGRDGSIRYEARFREIPLATGGGDGWRGWPHLVDSLLEWSRAGLDSGDQRVMGKVVEIKDLTDQGVLEQKEVILDEAPESPWIWGIRADARAPGTLLARAEGVSAGFGTVALRMEATLGREDFGSDYRPFRVLAYAGTFVQAAPADLNGAESVSQWFGAGPSIGLGFLGYVPRIEETSYVSRALELGFEVGAEINLVAVITRASELRALLTESDFYARFGLTGVLGFQPDADFGWALLLSLEASILPDLDKGGVALYSLGMGIGFRVSMDFRDLGSGNKTSLQERILK